MRLLLTDATAFIAKRRSLELTLKYSFQIYTITQKHTNSTERHTQKIYIYIQQTYIKCRIIYRKEIANYSHSMKKMIVIAHKQTHRHTHIQICL